MHATTTVTPDEFREVIGHFATGVTVITANDEDGEFGSTASAVSSLSLEPPRLLVCMNRQSLTGACIYRTGRFAVNILSEHQGDLAAHFASKSPDKFRNVSTSPGRLGEPLLEGALAHVECRVIEQISAGTHTVFLAEVERATAGTGSPLAYYRGQFGRLQLAADEHAYAALKALVVARRLPIGTPLDLAATARQAELPPVATQRALTRLAHEGFVERDERDRFVVAPITLEVIEDALRGRCAVQLGAATLSVGTISEDGLLELRRAMEATKPRRDDGTRLTMTEWFEANHALRLTMLRFAGSRALIEAYERFSVPGRIANAHFTADGPPDDIADDIERIVEAYDAGDLAAAIEAIRRDSEHGVRFNRQRIALAGGCI